MNLQQAAKDIAEFLGEDINYTTWRLSQGFHFNHAEVAIDFKKHDTSTDEALLEWYRCTVSYIYELSNYHCMTNDYQNLCDGVATHLSNLGKKDVLILGDGIGDLSIALKEAGLNPTYNDLAGGKTAQFAKFKFDSRGLNIPQLLTVGWDPMFPLESFDAVVAYDFMEHLPEDRVEEWTLAVYNSLKDGGIFQTQNAFGVGLHNMEDGTSSIPMHEASGERWVDEWDPMLVRLGFRDLGNGWSQKGGD